MFDEFDMDDVVEATIVENSVSELHIDRARVFEIADGFRLGPAVDAPNMTVANIARGSFPRMLFVDDNTIEHGNDAPNYE
ncbi:hypothetical protein L3V82_02310 [Thiotrichales bacterium 19S3-7]|nr:hypothetical protein [Thiotrichales bacterium 19S3-7]MCF6801000.1 hypothetical protein [Thiotrichales bacterium 19S3-11]